MNREGRTVNVKDWGRLGAKRVVLYEDRGELRFTDGFHDMRMTQARMEPLFLAAMQFWLMCTGE